MSLSFEKVCRTCLSSINAVIPLFDRKLAGEIMMLSSVAKMLKSFTSIAISYNDGLPTHVCISCIAEINQAYSFKIKCENSQITLKQYMQQPDNVSNSSDLVEVLQVHKIECDDTALMTETDTYNNDHQVSEDELHTYSDDKRKILIDCSITEKDDINGGEEAQVLIEDSNDDENQEVFIVDANEESDTGNMNNSSTEENFCCSVCCEVFGSKDLYDKHIDVMQNSKLLHDKQSKEPWKCQYCTIDFVHKKNLDKHIKKYHDVEFTKLETSDSIDIENEIVTNTLENNVLKPKATELPECSYRCEYCGAGFVKAKSLVYHMKSNKCKQKQFECHMCKKVFISKKSLIEHLDTHEKEEYKCAKCSKMFITLEELKQHTNREHNGTVKNQCPYCSKVFGMLSTLKDHLRTHSGEKPFLCSVCGKGFSQSTNLKQHMMRHTKTKPFKCTRCTYSFVSKGELNAHTRKHTGDHPFVCVRCGAGFTTSSSLVKHTRIHTGERPYACEFCPMRFTALGTLKNHRRTHTGEKPFVCKFCNRAFAQKSDCVAHMRTHTGERPYVCSICGFAFQQAGTMKTHFKIHEKEEQTNLADNDNNTIAIPQES